MFVDMLGKRSSNFERVIKNTYVTCKPTSSTGLPCAYVLLVLRFGAIGHAVLMLPVDVSLPLRHNL